MRPASPPLIDSVAAGLIRPSPMIPWGAETLAQAGLWGHHMATFRRPGAPRVAGDGGDRPTVHGGRSRRQGAVGGAPGAGAVPRPAGRPLFRPGVRARRCARRRESFPRAGPVVPCPCIPPGVHQDDVRMAPWRPNLVARRSSLLPPWPGPACEPETRQATEFSWQTKMDEEQIGPPAWKIGDD